jgi:hypothetical protein
MRIQNKIPFLFALMVLFSSILLVNCLSSIARTEDNTYLTPIPDSTRAAYREKRPINNRFDAVLEATQDIYFSRMRFTQGAPTVMFTEEMTLAEAKKLIPKDPGEIYSSEDRPDDTKVWLVVFKGSWQIAPPGGGLLPLETGCIYAILDANTTGHNRIRATSCQTMP